MAQTDANQLADLYKTVVSSCSAMTLGGKSACVDKKKKGKAWTDAYGQTCASYVSMVNSGQLQSCGKPYGSGYDCCGCGGGLMVQEWNDDSTAPPSSPSPPSPSPPPPSSPSSPSPPPAASKTCKDSTTYKDPRDFDTCSGWKGYPCDGHWFSAELKQNCPQACNVPCSTSPSPPPAASKTCKDNTAYKDPRDLDTCSGWKGFPCDGHWFSAELKQNCPQACNVPCSSCSPETTHVHSASKHWSDYCSKPAGKAWAMSSNCAAFAYYFGFNAQAGALLECQKYAAGNTCYIYDINGETC